MQQLKTFIWQTQFKLLNTRILLKVSLEYGNKSKDEHHLENLKLEK